MDVQKLPQDVREQPTTYTSVYRQGELVYDGAAAQSTGSDVSAAVAAARSAAAQQSAGPGASLNEFLKWGIENADPAELEAKARSGAAPPSQIDREIMDMLLGEPIVAKMRSCLAELEPEKLRKACGEEGALAAMEELEYYVEDIDNAMDMAKIGGIQALLRCCASSMTDLPLEEELARLQLPDIEVPEQSFTEVPISLRIRAAACSVLAAGLQNNPKVQAAALTLGVPLAMIRLLSLKVEDEESLQMQRKALLALSALMRSSSDALAAVLAIDDALATLLGLSALPDQRLRRRVLFLLTAICRDASSAKSALLKELQHTPHLLETLLENCASGDEDTADLAVEFLSEMADTQAASSDIEGAASSPPATSEEREPGAGVAVAAQLKLLLLRHAVAERLTEARTVAHAQRAAQIDDLFSWLLAN